MAREVIRLPLASSSSSTLPTAMPKATSSRLPVKAKRPILGERIENFEHSTPRQHLVKPVKSVIKPRVSASKSKSTPRPQTTISQETPARAVAFASSPAQSKTSSPAGANISRPGHTPHPRRSSVGLSQLINDQSLLMDTTAGFLGSDTDASEADEPMARNILARRGVQGPGRLMTPANSQDTQCLSQDGHQKHPSPRRQMMRLLTPPSSQPDNDNTLRKLVRARPAPTPPRKSTPSIRLNDTSAPASPTKDVSPNPRRKKSPRVDEVGPSRLRSPFELEAATTSASASPRHPKDRLEVVIPRARRVSTPSATPKQSAKTAKQGRLSTKTPSAPHPLSQSTSSQSGRARKAPSTAPAASRRKSTPGGAKKRQSPPRTSVSKTKTARTPRLSVRNTSRKSITPAELRAMAGILPEPVEQGSPSDDPLLLVDDTAYWSSKTPAASGPSRVGSAKSSSSTARIIDFDAAVNQGSSRSGRHQEEVVHDYEVPLLVSEPDYDVAHDYGFDSGGDSDEEGFGNDTFVHTAGGRSRSATGLDLMERQTVVEEQEQEEEEQLALSPRSSRPPSPFLRAASATRELALSPDLTTAQHIDSTMEEISPALSMPEFTSPRLPSHVTVGFSPAVEAPNSEYSQPPSPFLLSVTSPSLEVDVQHVSSSRRSSFAEPMALASSRVRQSPSPSPLHSRLATASPGAATPRLAALPAFSPKVVSHASPNKSEVSILSASPARSVRAVSSPRLSRSRSATPAAHTPTNDVSYSQDLSDKRESGSVRASSSTPRLALALLGHEDQDQTDDRTVSRIEPEQITLESRTSTPRNAPIALSPARSSRSHASTPSTIAGPPSPASLALDRISRGVPWSAEHLVSGTPSMLGLFLPEEADAQSTPVPLVYRGDISDSGFFAAEQEVVASTTPVAPLPGFLAFPPPRGSPAPLPDLEVDSVEDLPELSEDKENQPPQPFQSAEPSLSPTIRFKDAISLAFTSAPRFASPLRTAHVLSPAPVASAKASPAQLRGRSPTYSPVPPVESVNSRFEDRGHEFEQEGECASGDVTIEGISADWSLSDGELEQGIPEEDLEEDDMVEDLEESLLLDVSADHVHQGPEGTAELSEPHLRAQEEDEAVETRRPEDDLEQHSANVEDDQPASIEEESVFEEAAIASTAIEDNTEGDHSAIFDKEVSVPEPADLTTAIENSNDGEGDSDLQEEDISADLRESSSEALQEENQVCHDQEQESDEEGAPSSDTLADTAGFESSFEDEEGKDTPTEEAPAATPSPAVTESQLPPAPVYQEKIILRIIDRGIVKIEQEEEESTISQQVPVESDVRSTTPAYDPPVLQAATPARTPVAAAVYPSLPATPIFAPLSPLPQSTTPLATPPTHVRTSSSSVAAATAPAPVQEVEPAPTLLPEPSTRPRSRLSRQINQGPESDDEQDPADRSIRLRGASALGDGMDDADNSMRSVVEVSSFDPKAAARAAAILKLNHAYIEHGDITKLGEPQQAESPRRRSFHSARLDKLDASRRGDKTDLLYEAELEIVSTRRSRSRSMSRFRGVSEALTELPLPGAWNGTPKRKRSAYAHAGLETTVEEKTTPSWGVSQWKKLEKVFRAEREVWVTEREVKAMPGGFIGWARMSTFGPPAPSAKVWDPMRVVERFIREQNIKDEDQVGDWSVDIIRTRVEALERHAEQRVVKAKNVETETRSPKKIKMAETPMKAIARPAPPPSTVRKLFGWVLPGSTKSSVSDTTSTPVAKPDRKGKGRAVDNGDDAFNEGEGWNRPMTQLDLGSSISIPLNDTPLHPSSPAWRMARPAPPLLNTTNNARPTPRTLSAILAESSSTMSGSTSSRHQDSLSFSQKSQALDALFGGSTCKLSYEQARAVRAPIVKRVSSVKDMVKSFEESGAFDRAMKKP